MNWPLSLCKLSGQNLTAIFWLYQLKQLNMSLSTCTQNVPGYIAIDGTTQHVPNIAIPLQLDKSVDTFAPDHQSLRTAANKQLDAA